MAEKPLFVISQEEKQLDLSDTELVFLLQSEDEFALNFPFFHQDFWGDVSHRVSREPKKLIAHLQRIYFCYNNDLSEKLYASLVDLIIALQGKRDGLSRRMFLATKGKLKEQHSDALKQFFAQKELQEHELPSSIYTVLSNGIIGHKLVLQATHTQTAPEYEYNPLDLARDYIEYSQLDEARGVLEKAIEEDPENAELHSELLGLYKSMNDYENFAIQHKLLKEKGCSLMKEWDELLPELGEK